MSKETLEWLNGGNVLVGYTEKRGTAWWYDPELSLKDVPNHYEGSVPIEAATDLLNQWEAMETPIYDPAVTDGVILSPPRFLRAQDQKSIRNARTGEVYYRASSGYVIHQYVETLLGKIKDIIDDDTLGIGSVVVLAGGAEASVTIELPENVTTPDGIQFRPCLTAMTSFNGKLATGFGTHFTMVVCDNTRDIARREMGDRSMKWKHTKYSLPKIADIRGALQIVQTASDEFTENVSEQLGLTVSDAEWERFLDAYVPFNEPDGKPKSDRAVGRAKKKRSQLSNLWEHDNRVSPWRGTAFGVLQAVNTHETHLKGNIPKDQSRMEYNMFHTAHGDFGKLDTEAFCLLTDVLKGA